MSFNYTILWNFHLFLEHYHYQEVALYKATQIFFETAYSLRVRVKMFMLVLHILLLYQLDLIVSQTGT
jgi:hypothetical protein